MHFRRGPFNSQENSIGDSPMSSYFTPLLLLLLVIPSTGRGQQSQDERFTSLVSAAQRAQRVNDYDAAANSYKEAVRLRQDIPELWADLGLMQYESHDFAGSVRSFQQALRLKPSLYVPHLFLGLDCMRMGNANEAIPYLVKAETMNHTDPLVPLTLGRAYSSQRKFQAAALAYERAIELDSEKSSAWFGLGITLLNEVEEDARRITEEDQDSSYAKVLYAESLAKQARYTEAIDTYRTVPAAQPQPPCTHANLGFLLLKQRDTAGAAAAFQVERQTDSGCSLAVLGQARLRLDEGSDDDALTLLKDLWNRDQGFFTSNAPVLVDGLDQARNSAFQQFLGQQSKVKALSPDFSAFLANLLNRQSPPPQTSLPLSDPISRTAKDDYSSGRYAQCASHSNNSLRTKNVVGLQLLATCAYFTGDYQLTSNASEALAAAAPHSLAAVYWSIKANEHLAFIALDRFQQLEPDSSRIHLLLGDIYRQRMRFEDAQAEYQRALAISPGDPAALIGLASAYFGDGNNGEAIETAQLALNLTPDDPELNLLMAEALIANQEMAPAEQYLQKALNAKPQMLPHVHALLGEVYADAGKTQQAIDQLVLGIKSDEDGSLHYQLARLYRKIGDSKDADAAMEQTKVMKQLRRQQRAVAAVRDSGPSTPDSWP
jgi:tetratricopeptide (TPR) repeat protein